MKNELKIEKPRRIVASLREVIYMLSLKKKSVEEQHEILRRYEDRINIQKPDDPWNLVNHEECSVKSIHEARAKIEKYIDDYVATMDKQR